MRLLEWLKGLLAGQRPGDEGEAPTPSLQDKEPGDGLTDDEDFFAEPVVLEIEDVFDLHTIGPREVKAVVEEYLSEAYRAGFRSVRIIHGKGKGMQREMVRAILARTPFVTSWTDAPPQAGGWGATVVHFSPVEKEWTDNRR